MSETSISSLDLISKAQIDPANDIVGLVDKSDTSMSVNGSNKKATIESLVKSVLDDFSWGDIGGDIGDQTDLSLVLAALDAAKLDKTGGTLTGVLAVSAGTAISSTPILNLIQTWNNVGVVFSGIKANITDTASATGSLILDLQTNGNSRFKVDKTANIRLKGSGLYPGDYGPDSGIQVNGNGALILKNGNTIGQVGDYGFVTAASSGFNWSTNFGTMLLSLLRDADNVLAQRNSTAAQRFNLYGTYTDASNYRRLYISSTTGGTFTLGVEGLGTGANANVLRLNTTNTTYASTDRLIEFQNNGTTYQAIRPTGSLTKPLHVFVGTDFDWVGTGAGYGNTGAEWEKWLFTVSNDQNHCFGVKYDSVSLGMNTAIRWHNNVYITQSADLALVRNAAGQLDIRGNSGLRVRNFGNTDWVNVQIGELWLNNRSGDSPKIKMYVSGNEAGFFYLDGWETLSYRFQSANPCRFALQGANGTAATNHAFSFADATELWTEGANVLAIRRSTNAQNLRLYGTYTDSSNYRRFYINSTTGGTFTLGVTGAGTGASGNTLTITANNINVGDDANNRWVFGNQSFTGTDLGSPRIVVTAANNGRIYLTGSSRVYISNGTTTNDIMDVELGRRDSSRFAVFANNGFSVRNQVNNADAPLTAGALTISDNITLSNRASQLRIGTIGGSGPGAAIGCGTNGSLDVYGYNGQSVAASFWNTNAVSPGLVFRSLHGVYWSSALTPEPNAVDSGITRVGTGIVDLIANNGFRVRNYANTDWAALQCGAITTAGTLTVRNSTTATRLELYGTYTDASNYRRLYVSSTTGGAFTLGVQGLGTGASDNTFNVIASQVTFATPSNNARFYVEGYALRGYGDDLWLQASYTLLLNSSQNISLEASDALKLQATNSVKVRCNSGLSVRNNGDSAAAPVQGKITTETNYTAGAPTATGYLILYDATGTAYRVPAVLN